MEDRYYMTRIKLDLSKIETRRALGAPAKFHGAIEHAFDVKQKRNLWRIDKLNGESYILLISRDRPNMESFSEQFCHPEEKAETKEYTPFLNNIGAGSTWRFRYRGNPVNTDSEGKRRSHVTSAQQINWFLKYADKYGFKLLDCWTDGYTWDKFQHGENGVITLKLVDFTGFCEVTDPIKFREMLVTGIGHAKAFGSGMFTVVKAM